MGKSVVIIGKGPSILRTSSAYINSFDKIVIINRPVWEGYEKFIPKKAHIQYRNNSTQNFSKEEIKELGLEKVVSTAHPGEKLHPDAHHDLIEVEYPPFTPGPDRSIIMSSDPLDPNTHFLPSSGPVAVAHLLSKDEFSKMALVGFDLMALDHRAYYFKTNELQRNLKYLFGLGYYSSDENFIRLKPSDHNIEQTQGFLVEKMKQYADVKFEVTTDNVNFYTLLTALPNVSLK